MFPPSESQKNNENDPERRPLQVRACTHPPNIRCSILRRAYALARRILELFEDHLDLEVDVVMDIPMQGPGVGENHLDVSVVVSGPISTEQINWLLSQVTSDNCEVLMADCEVEMDD